MSIKLSTSVLRRPLLSASSSPSTQSTTRPRISSPSPSSLTQVRHATFVPRPRRPYQFTQLVQLSDGSTFTVRTTMPQGLLKSTKDSRNHMIWQPSNKSLRNVEVDEAGKLAAFRERFGRGWDLDTKPAVEGAEETAAATTQPEAVAVAGKKEAPQQKQAAPAAPAAEVVEEDEEDPFDSLTDLISSYAKPDQNIKGGKTAKEQDKLDKTKKK